MWSDVIRAAETISAGGVIAHATEGVWGFACDPCDTAAVQRILQIKERPADKGLLLIAATAEFFNVELTNVSHRAKIEASWPGPHTWVLPNQRFTSWVTGDHGTVACRVPGHPQARALCAAVNKPLVSTSANRGGDAPAVSEDQVRELFSAEVDLILSGAVVDAGRPSTIYDLNGNVIRG